MQKFLLSITLVFLCACSSAPTVTAPPPAAPAVQETHKAAPHPFAMALDPEFIKTGWKKWNVDGDNNLNLNELKDALIASYTASDRSDGKRDGVVEVDKACSLAPGICRGADANHDSHLAIDEFLDRVDAMFARADLNQDGTLQANEIKRLAK